jgi:osmotically-inducible protein OsmY
MTSSFLRRIAAFFAVICFAAITACSSTPRSEGTGEYIDDTLITTQVKAAIVADPNLKATEINVETFKGRVQLSGFVNSQADIARAVEVARGIKGVKSVVNDMRLK